MTRLADLETPFPVVDLDVVEANLVRMQTYCDRHGLKLRPHVKTHKSPELAQRQIALGAVGITCQKLGEAEVMADNGITDILISYPLVGVGKAARLAALAARVQMSVSVESDQVLATAAQAAALSNNDIHVFIDFDSGAGRTGVQSAVEALQLAKRVVATPGLVFKGLITYPLTPESNVFFEKAHALFDKEQLPISGFSGAGTPAAWSAHLTHGLTEVRQGTYIFNDRAVVGAGMATLDDCAVHVWTTVVGRPTHHRAILDAGSKSLSSDRVAEEVGAGFGLIREYPEAIIERLYEEHAIVSVPEGCNGLQIGERIRVLPNHVCVVVNLHDTLVTSSKGLAVGQLPVLARGKSR